MARQGEFAARMALVVLGVFALVWLHVAVCLTTGADWSFPGAGIDALKATVHYPGAEAAPATTATLIVWGAGVLVAIVLVIVWAFRSGKRSTTGGAARLASGRDLHRTARGTNRQHRPALTRPIAMADGRPVMIRTEENGIVVGPPRRGKTMYLAVGLVADAPGPVVTTSTRPDVLRLTGKVRSDFNPDGAQPFTGPDGQPAGSRIWVFDPEGLSAWPHKARWDIVAGCEDDVEADERARAMVAARDTSDSGNAKFFQESAHTVLRCLLHAAALKAGGNMRDVMAWSRDFTDDEPYDILKSHPQAKAGWRDDLKKYCRGEASETVSSTDMSLGLVLKAFGLGGMLDAVCPPPGTGFDAASFHASTDTLYLIAAAKKYALAAPVITALITTIKNGADHAAMRSASGRLKRPMTLVLDEIANVAPIPDLEALMSAGGGSGIVCWPFMQSRNQLSRKYGRDEAKDVFDSAAAEIVLSGSKDMDHLQDLSRYAGKARVERVSHTVQSSGDSSGSTSHSTEMDEIMRPEHIRTIGPGKAFFVYSDQYPAIVDLIAWWNRPDAKRFRESMSWVKTIEGIPEGEVEDATAEAEAAMREDVAREDAELADAEVTA